MHGYLDIEICNIRECCDINNLKDGVRERNTLVYIRNNELRMDTPMLNLKCFVNLLLTTNAYYSTRAIKGCS